MGEALGVAAIAAEAARGGAILPLRDPVQLELVRDARGELDRGAIRRLPAARAGRPKGARNKRTEALARYLVQQHGDPLVALASLYGRATDALAAELGCKPIEALALQVKAAAEVAPYVHGKQPVQLDITKREDFVIVMAAAGEVGALGERIRAQGLEALDFDRAEMADFSHCDEGEGGPLE